MSIASEITRITGNISDAYTAAQAKGATMPATQNSGNLATTISTISGSSVDTRGWTSKTIDANGKLVNSSTAPNFTDVEDLGNYVLNYVFFHNTALTVVNFPDLTTISGTSGMDHAFSDCTGLTSVGLNALTAITGAIGMGYAFNGCTGLTSMSFPVLATITGSSSMQYAFRNCTGLTSVSFPALKTNSFGYNTNQFSNMLKGVTGCTIHFPSNLDPQTGSTTISSLTGYPDFGGTNTVLAFDLPATE